MTLSREEALELMILDGVADGGIQGLSKAVAEAMDIGYTDDEIRVCLERNEANGNIVFKLKATS